MAAKWRVMTVDGSAATLPMIAAYLEDSEFRVVASERDGVMAVERCARERPHVVLLDLLMQGQPRIDTLGRMLAVDPEALVVVPSSTESDRALVPSAGPTVWRQSRMRAVMCRHSCRRASMGSSAEALAAG